MKHITESISNGRIVLSVAALNDLLTVELFDPAAY